MKKHLAVGLLIISFPHLSWTQSLQETVQTALNRNPEVLFNVAKSHSVEQGILEAKGRYYPSVDVALGNGQEKTINPVTVAIGGASSNQWLNRQESSVELSQSVFAGWGIVGEVARNYNEWMAQKFKTLAIAQDTALDATERYYDVLKQQQNTDLARANLQEHQRLFKMVRRRATAGVGREAELEQAKARLALANSNFLSVENALREAKIRYLRVVGEPALNLLTPKVPSAADLPKTLPQAIRQGLDCHPSLKSARAEIKQARDQKIVEKSKYYPRVDFIARGAKNRNLDGLVGKNDESLAMVRLSYNVYRGGSDTAAIRQASFQIQESLEAKSRAVLEVEELTRLAWYAWETATKRLPYLKTHVSASYKTRLAYTEQFKVGKRTLLDLLDSQNEYYFAQIDKVAGEIDEAFFRYRILNSIGAILPFLNSKVPSCLPGKPCYQPERLVLSPNRAAGVSSRNSARLTSVRELNRELRPTSTINTSSSTFNPSTIQAIAK